MSEPPNKLARLRFAVCLIIGTLMFIAGVELSGLKWLAIALMIAGFLIVGAGTL